MSSHLATTFPVCFSARNPHRPHPRKATLWRVAHITPSGPPPVQVNSGGPEQETTCPGHKTGMGILLSCFPVRWLFSTFSWPACPGRTQRRGMRANSHVQLSPGGPRRVWAGPHSLPSLASSLRGLWGHHTRGQSSRVPTPFKRVRWQLVAIWETWDESAGLLFKVTSGRQVVWPLSSELFPHFAN